LPSGLEKPVEFPVVFPRYRPPHVELDVGRKSEALPL
jgi:hypothetical protein